MKLLFGTCILLFSSLAYSTPKIDCSELSDPARQACEKDVALLQRVQSQQDTEVLDYSSFKLSIERTCLNANDKRYLSDRVQLGLDQIPIVTSLSWDNGHYGSQKLEIFVLAENAVSHVFGGYLSGSMLPAQAKIFFPCGLFKQRRAPIVHELTHLFAWNYWSGTLREGIANYVQFTLLPQEPAAFIEPFENPHDVSRRLYRSDQNTHLLQELGAPGYPNFESAIERQDFYHYTMSFFYSLVERFGLPRVVEIYSAQDEEMAFQRLLSEGLQAIKMNWISEYLDIEQLSKR